MGDNLCPEMNDAEQNDLLSLLRRLSAQFSDVPMSELAALLSMMRAEALVHQAHHWQTRGASFYGDHLMFERIYKDVHKQNDALAERTVGYGSYALVSPVIAASQIHEVVSFFYAQAPKNPEPNDYVMTSLRAALWMLGGIKIVRRSLEAKGQLSNGIDNLLQTIADTQEEHVYLLKQRAKV